MEAFWGTLLRNSSRLSRLQKLDGVILDSPETAQRVAALTQLTCLVALPLQSPAGQLNLALFGRDEFSQLSHLTALQKLTLCGHAMHIPFSVLRGVVGAMTQLRSLDVGNCMAALSSLDSLLASRLALTELRIWGPLLSHEIPPEFNCSGFASLKSLSVVVWHGSVHGMLLFCAVLTRLECLQLDIRPDMLKPLLGGLSPMPLLTRLEVNALGIVDVQHRPSASYLASFPHLKHLHLARNVLDVRRRGSDVMHLAALTGLTSLHLFWFDSFADLGAKPLTSVQLEPLTALTNLQSMVATPPWGLACACEFREAMQSMQRGMGLPNVKFKDETGKEIV